MVNERSISTFVIIKTSFEGLHCWKNIPSGHKSQFLKHPHRHVFNFELYFEVKHDDRDVEFFDMKDKINKVLNEWFPRLPDELLPDMGSISCEKLAGKLLRHFESKNCHSVRVYEDGENGAVVSLTRRFV